jgi:hypothetical protein
MLIVVAPFALVLVPRLKRHGSLPVTLTSFPLADEITAIILRIVTITLC